MVSFYAGIRRRLRLNKRIDFALLLIPAYAFLHHFIDRIFVLNLLLKFFHNCSKKILCLTLFIADVQRCVFKLYLENFPDMLQEPPAFWLDLAYKHLHPLYLGHQVRAVLFSLL